MENKMNIVFAGSPLPLNLVRSIFLAGPSPRELGVVDWRHEAVEFLKSINFTGTLFIPIPESRFYGQADVPNWNYQDQVDWECKCRSISDVILFWVPRSIEGKMPAFVTNIEFGEDLASGRIVYGRPDTAEKCKYLDKRITDMGLPVHKTLEDTFRAAINQLGDGAFRQQGEINIPLFIWHSEMFQSWYSNLKLSGNRLEDARVHSHVTLHNTHLFSYVLWVNIWVEAEQRYKSNEYIVSRKDTSSVVAYFEDGANTKVVMIKEFRSTVNNSEGFVYELPSGSNFSNSSPLINAREELHEETGLFIEDEHRFEYVTTRQLLATFSTHQSHLYKVKLNEAEYKELVSLVESDSNLFGSKDSSERTSVVIFDTQDLPRSLVDFSVIGMVHTALAGRV